MSEAPDYIAISIDNDGTASVETAYFGSCHIYAHDRILAAQDAEIDRLQVALKKARIIIDDLRLYSPERVDAFLDDPANALTDPAAPKKDPTA